MLKRLKKAYSFRRILWDMSIQQLKAKYAGSKLGLWWAVIVPLLLALSINLIFTAAFKVSTPRYYLFVLAGLIPWLFSTNALGEATNAFGANIALLKQAIFPREMVPFSAVFSSFLNFLIGLAFLLALFIAPNYHVIKSLPLLFLIVFINLIFIAGLSLLFSTINAFHRDLSYFLSIGFTIWFWITPIFYSLENIEFPFRWICLLNPMTYYVISYQQILFEAKMPDLFVLFIASALAFFSIIGGYLFFLKNEPLLLKRI